MTSGAARVLALAVLLGLPGAEAWAQTAARPGQPPASRRARPELSVGGTFLVPTSFGSADANLTAPDGSAVPLFRTKNGLGVGYGLEAHIGFGAAAALSAEISGAWARAPLQTTITSDFENADTITVSEPLHRFSLEGAAIWRLSRRGATTVFLRSGAGWMRELAGGSLVEDGLVVNVGAGVKYWWRQAVAGKGRSLGLRLEGRASVRTAAITLGERKTRVTPVVTAGLVFGF